MIEAAFQDLFQAELRKRHCYVRSLVGSTLQSGLPDMLVRAPSGYLFLVENKRWTKKYAPTSKADFYDLLDGPQRNVIINQLHGFGSFCPIVAFIRDQPDYCYYFDGATHISKMQWIFLAKYFSELGRT